MCCFILPLEIILINNSTCQSNVLLLPNTESTIFFASILIILFGNFVLVFVGHVLQLFLGKKGIKSHLSLSLFCLCPILIFFPFSSEFIILSMKSFLFVQSVVPFSSNSFIIIPLDLIPPSIAYH